MRLFIATTFPPEVLRDLNEKVARVRPRLPAASWVREETQHLTLAFLGEREERVIAAIEPKMETALAAIAAFPATVRGCGFFPNLRRARVGWAGLEPEETFVALARLVRDVLAQEGIVLDGATFKPHLTLARIRDPWPPTSAELFHKTFDDYISAPFQVDAVTLYSSKLNPKGAVHTPLRTFALG